MSGSSTRNSTTTNTISARTPRISNPMVWVLPQPHSRPLLIASSSDTSDTSDTERIPAPMRSSRPGARTGDSGTPKNTPASAAAISTSQNSHSHDRLSTNGPASTMPSPAPIPKTAEAVRR